MDSIDRDLETGLGGPKGEKPKSGADVAVDTDSGAAMAALDTMPSADYFSSERIKAEAQFFDIDQEQLDEFLASSQFENFKGELDKLDLEESVAYFLRLGLVRVSQLQDPIPRQKAFDGLKKQFYGSVTGKGREVVGDYDNRTFDNLRWDAESGPSDRMKRMINLLKLDPSSNLGDGIMLDMQGLFHSALLRGTEPLYALSSYALLRLFRKGALAEFDISDDDFAKSVLINDYRGYLNMACCDGKDMNFPRLRGKDKVKGDALMPILRAEMVEIMKEVMFAMNYKAGDNSFFKGQGSEGLLGELGIAYSEECGFYFIEDENEELNSAFLAEFKRGEVVRNTRERRREFEQRQKLLRRHIYDSPSEDVSMMRLTSNRAPVEALKGLFGSLVTAVAELENLNVRWTDFEAENFKRDSIVGNERYAELDAAIVELQGLKAEYDRIACKFYLFGKSRERDLAVVSSQFPSKIELIQSAFRRFLNRMKSSFQIDIAEINLGEVKVDELGGLRLHLEAVVGDLVSAYEQVEFVGPRKEKIERIRGAVRRFKGITTAMAPLLEEYQRKLTDPDIPEISSELMARIEALQIGDLDAPEPRGERE